MKQRTRRSLIIAGAVIALVVIIYSVVNRGACSYYGYQTDRETRYAAFVGCMVKTSSGWALRSELRTTQ
ncbi:hypothetical protein [Pseudomonas baetica]|uniref:hypothetical protein n=1 Tax=Pseudomonas baetica TaxID=674054 RepID=UPI0021AB887C|nr:hypothetical protein [Pseudomonas baetica]